EKAAGVPPCPAENASNGSTASVKRRFKSVRSEGDERRHFVPGVGRMGAALRRSRTAGAGRGPFLRSDSGRAGSSAHSVLRPPPRLVVVLRGTGTHRGHDW